MLIPGLVSITFRPLPPRRVVALAAEAGLATIEWGGDGHVPHGDAARAREVRAMTEEAGLSVAAYGSYYRVGESEREGLSFESVLASALALGAPTVRVWAGRRGSADADEGYRERVAAESTRIADAASREGLTVSYEYHGKTLTDTNESARRLLADVAHPAIRTLWQPPNGRAFDYCMEGLRAVLPLLTNVHVFHWATGRKDQTALAEGEERWVPYLAAVSATGGSNGALIEFVKGDSPEQLRRDAAALVSWLARIHEQAKE